MHVKERIAGLNDIAVNDGRAFHLLVVDEEMVSAIQVDSKQVAVFESELKMSTADGLVGNAPVGIAQSSDNVRQLLNEVRPPFLRSVQYDQRK
jgi:hypothetical protein